jgi:uncharacterized protein
MSNSLWDNNEIQFARLIEEMQCLGIPDGYVSIEDLEESMDLNREELLSLFERARKVWEDVKREHCK